MDPVLATAAAAAGLFAVTNVDDLVVLAMLNASSRATGRRVRRRSTPRCAPTAAGPAGGWRPGSAPAPGSCRRTGR